MNTYEGLCGRLSNISTYVTAALAFVGLPLAFYLGTKYSLPIYQNVGAVLFGVPTIYLTLKIVCSRSAIRVEDAGLECCNLLLNRRSKSFKWNDLETVELTSDNNTRSLVLKFKCTGTVWVPKADDDLISLVVDHAKEYTEKSIGDKSSYKVAAVAIGIVIIDLLLIFLSIYIAT